MTQIEALTSLLNANGMHAKAWKGQRVYLNSLGRDISAYITMDSPAQSVDAIADWRGPGQRSPTGLFTGCALKVYCSQEIKSSAVARAKQVKHGLMQQLAAAMIADGCPADQWEVTDDWRNVIL